MAISRALASQFWVVLAIVALVSPRASAQVTLADVLAALVAAPVLTVGDSPAFTSLGGTAHLFMEGQRMRFAVNVESAQRANLRMSAQLLSLATIVKSEHVAR